MKIERIEFGGYYHILNRGNNGINLFFENDNYRYFMQLYDRYIFPIADTYAWCLLKNHFHFLIRIKEVDEIDKTGFSYSTKQSSDKISPSGQFSHFFNAYTQAINKKYGRTGSLFEKPFQRKIVSSESYFRKLIFYIHNNPVHHGMIDRLDLYPWSSYKTIISDASTKLKRSDVIEYFEDLENFIYYHQQNQNLKEIDELLIE